MGLVQGGLEVPGKVTVLVSESVINHLLFNRYKKLLNELYIEIVQSKKSLGLSFQQRMRREKGRGKIAKVKKETREERSEFK